MYIKTNYYNKMICTIGGVCHAYVRCRVVLTGSGPSPIYHTPYPTYNKVLGRSTTEKTNVTVGGKTRQLPHRTVILNYYSS